MLPCSCSAAARHPVEGDGGDDDGALDDHLPDRRDVDESHAVEEDADEDGSEGADQALTWAAEEAARAGSIPAIYRPLRAWADGFFRLGYVGSFAAMALFGWAFLRTGLLAPALGWVVIGWSILCFVGWLAGAGAPAVPFIMPAVIGVALLWRQS